MIKICNIIYDAKIQTFFDKTMFDFIKKVKSENSKPLTYIINNMGLKIGS